MAVPVPTFSSGASAVFSVARSFSDLVFRYPFLTLDQEPANEDAQVITLDVGANAAAAVRGALAVGSPHVSVFLSSPHLPLFVPSLLAIAQQHRAVVVHVACESVNADFAAFGSYEAVYALRDAGAVLLNAATPQECHDIAVAAHVLATKSQTLVVQFYDATRVAKEQRSLRIASKATLQALKGEIKPSAAGNALEDAQQVFDDLVAVVDKQYKLVEYTGAQDAETVVVVLGEAAGPLQVAANKSDSKVGVLQVRALLPWAHARVAAALPSTVRKVAVVENISVGALATHQALLTQCVQSFFLSAEWRDHHADVPEITTGIYGGVFGQGGFSVAKAQAVFKHVENASASRGFIIAQSREQVQEQAVLALDVVYGEDFEEDAIGQHFVVLGYNELSEPSQQVETRFASILQTLNNNSSTQVRGLVKYSTPAPTQPFAVAALHVQVVPKSNATVDELPLIEPPAKLVVVERADLLKTLDFAKSIQVGGTLLVHGNHKTSEELELDAILRAGLAAKNIALRVVDADSLEGRVKDEAIAKLTPLIAFLRASELFDESAAHELLSAQLPEAKHAPLKVQVASVWNSLVTFPYQEKEKEDATEENRPHVPWQSLAPSKLSYSLSACQRLHRPHRISRRVSTETQTLQKLIFREALTTKHHVRAHATDVLRVTKWERLTPEDYGRNVFHLEMDIRGTSISYSIGEALAVLAPNDEKEVLAFLESYGVEPEGLVALPVARRGGRGQQDVAKEEETLTNFQLFSHVLDIFGRPSKKFYAALAERATDGKEKELLDRLISAEGKDEYKRRVDETVTFAELLVEFPSARPTMEDLIKLVPRIKPRHYSIASSIKMHPDSVHLLIVVHDWTTPSGRHRIGHATRFLSQVTPGQMISVAVCSSVMKMPKNPADPIIMAGLGTGMAPFRAFIQERAFFKAQGITVGPIALYFGSRHRAKEFMYGSELEKYAEEGLLTLRCAFSRDQAYKIYIQDRISEDKKMLADWLLQKNGHFYLCGPTWPVGDVRDALISSFKSEGGLERQQANATIERMRDEGRYVLEVY